MPLPLCLLTSPSENVARWVESHLSERKCRLFAVACCRLVREQITYTKARVLIELAERWADGAVRASQVEQERRHVFRWANAQEPLTMTPEEVAAATHDPTELVTTRWEERWAAYMAAVPKIVPPCGGFLGKREYRPLLADIAGNPFRPVAFDPAWRTDTAIAIARQMYDSREFGAMPILADALQDAGCEDEQVLTHCRGPGPHVRGCWVCDLVLGRA